MVVRPGNPEKEIQEERDEAWFCVVLVAHGEFGLPRAWAIETADSLRRGIECCFKCHHVGWVDRLTVIL